MKSGVHSQGATSPPPIPAELSLERLKSAATILPLDREPERESEVPHPNGKPGRDSTGADRGYDDCAAAAGTAAPGVCAGRTKPERTRPGQAPRTFASLGATSSRCHGRAPPSANRIAM